MVATIREISPLITGKEEVYVCVWGGGNWEAAKHNLKSQHSCQPHHRGPKYPNARPYSK